MSEDRMDFDGVQVHEDVAVAMRDGVRLTADVYLPDSDFAVGSLPTILMRTAIDKAMPQPDLAPDMFARRGYAVVVQNVRGRYGSEGVFHQGAAEVDDGFDTLAWIAAQSWSDGRVGMVGISYTAAVQCAAAISGSEHLASILHIFAPWSYYRSCHRHAGLAALYIAVQVARLAAGNTEARQDPSLLRALDDHWANASDWIHRLPLKRGMTPLARVPAIEDWIFSILGHPEYGPFWSRLPLWEPHEYLDDYVDVPGLYVGGWYDMYHEEGFYDLLARRKNGPIRLLIGPWTHMESRRDTFESPTALGDVYFGPESELPPDRLAQMELDWFDETLLGKSASRSPVRIFVMGGGDGRKGPDGRMNHGGQWRDETTWPLERAQPQSLFLGANGSLDWASSPNPDEESTTYRHDPTDPVPTIGGVHFFMRPPFDPFVPYGPWDQSERREFFGGKTDLPLSSRQDVLTFQTAPLEADVEVTGTPSVKLWVSSTALDTDFMAKLIDVHPPNDDYPNGYAMNLAEGACRMRYRDSLTEARLMEPGSTYEIEIELYATSNLFVKGHRIRLDISSSNFPAYDVNQNDGGPLLSSTPNPVVATNTVFHDPIRPSQVRLPLVPVG